MRVLFSTFGSRGDVQPLVGLAVRLRELGARVRVCAPPDREFADLLERAGVPLAPAFIPVREWIAAVSAQPAVDLPARAAEVMRAQYEAIAAAAEGCDAVVATGLFPSAAAAQAVAERRGLRYVYATFCSLFVPSSHRRPFAYPGHPHPPGATDNRALWERDIATMNALFGEAVNGHRASLGLARAENVRDHVFTGDPWIASDPVLDPWPPGDREVVQTGAWLFRDPRPLPDDLLGSLDAGRPPVYVGFGSMPLRDAHEAARVAVAAIRAQGRRAIVSRGWAGLAPAGADDCFSIGEVNQQALFRRVAAVVHHGGAGTTTAAARAAVPQVIVPQAVDQPYWAERVAALGIGVAHDGPVATVASLSAALGEAMALETCARAVGVAGMVEADGAAIAARRLFDAIECSRTPALA
jgi:vancomycin aglycone glucosyltransferase